MSVRPDADRSLTPVQVCAALADQFDDIKATTATHLAEGWDFEIYEVGEWLFRFPRHRGAIAGMVREGVMLPAIAAAVKVAGLEAPIYSKRGAPGDHFPYPFSGYKKIAGVRADHAEIDENAVAKAIGVSLDGVHRLPPVPIIPSAEETPADWFAAAQSKLEALAPLLTGRLVEARAWLETPGAAPMPFEGQARLLHNDLGPEHILVDPQTGQPLGIIDWSDLAVGDPALDFVALYCWRGPGFLNAVRRHYTLPVDDEFGPRVVFYARAMSLIWLAEAQESGSGVQRQLDWVRNVFC